MECKLVLRSKWKISIVVIVCAAVLCIAFSFDIRYMIDRKCMSYAEDNYAYIGTVYKMGMDHAAYIPIDQSAIDILEETSCVEEINYRPTFSAKIPNMENVPSFFYRPFANQKILFRGKIEKNLETHDWEPILQSIYEVKVEKLYAGQSNWIEEGDNITVSCIATIDSTVEEDKGVQVMEENEEYLFYGLSSMADAIGIMDKSIFVFQISEEYIPMFDNGVVENAYTLYTDGLNAISGDLKDWEIEAYCIDCIRSLGLDYLEEEIAYLDDIYSVHTVKNMQMLPAMVNETMFISQGRELSQNDIGERICVISNKLAVLQKLSVGDHISMSLGDDCYTNEGYESGFPMENEAKEVTYDTPLEYEIVGIYEYSNYEPANATLLFNYNDIFIPPDNKEDIPETIYPYSLSFRVKGNAYDIFQETIGKALKECGYEAYFTASKWNDVEEIYQEITNQLGRITILGFLAKLLGAVLLAALVIIFYRNEFVLRILIGSDILAASKAYIYPIVITAGMSLLPGILWGFWTAYTVSIDLQNSFPGIEQYTIADMSGMFLLTFLQIVIFTTIVIGIVINRDSKRSVRDLIF